MCKSPRSWASRSIDHLNISFCIFLPPPIRHLVPRKRPLEIHQALVARLLCRDVSSRFLFFSFLSIHVSFYFIFTSVRSFVCLFLFLRPSLFCSLVFLFDFLVSWRGRSSVEMNPARCLIFLMPSPSTVQSLASF